MHFESSWNYLSGNSSRGGYFHCGRGGRRGGRNGRVSIHCQICNKYGHTTSICYHRLNPTYVAQPYNFYPHSNPAQLYNSHQNFFPKNVSAMVFSFFCTTSVFASHQFSAPPQFCTAAVSNPLPQAYATQSVPTQQTQNWFIDSSASHHITTDATNLVEDVSTQEDENVFLGNEVEKYRAKEGLSIHKIADMFSFTSSKTWTLADVQEFIALDSPVFQFASQIFLGQVM
ncbi:hypothetical protein ACSQ67_006080 [Phaseolus vulgaris]